MEPSRTRNARDVAAAEARARPSTQYASMYPAYPEQAQQLRPRADPTGQAAQQYAEQARAAQAHQQAPTRLPQPPQTHPQASLRPGQYPAATTRTSPVRRLLGVLTFFVLTGLSLPLHIMAFFFVYVQIESPGDTASAVPLLGGMFAGAFIALFFTGLLTQLVGGFPGRWRARVTFAFLSGTIALVVAYAAAITQF